MFNGQTKKEMNEDFTIKKYPSIYWEKFFNKFLDINTLPIEQWNTANLIGYFCKKYKDYYGLDYTFKFNSNSPGKSYEVYLFNKLSNMLSSNPQILKDYIDWVFAIKIMAKKKRITSMAFLTDTNSVNDYKFNKLLFDKNKSIDRSTTIPPIYTNIINKYGFNITNYGELSFIKKCVDSGNGEQSYKTMLNELSGGGLDIAVLDKVK